KKLCARWMPHLLTTDQKCIRMRNSQACLAHFNRFKQNKVVFKRRFITVDETRIHHYTQQCEK
ncbi:hypothetical protein EAI_02351, partial [Harpegnathos saltator]